ncbi:MAG TPA: SDR family NAD(P)-dependent oxidoreductase [Dehalococcoidia bacterium]|nr:SDR family NAD(P)-dependent oxidoreductase [Dehalococcoidia bacterium]
MRLANKVALVVGGGSGIGRAISLRFAQEGATVVVGDVRGGAADAVVAEIAQSGGQATAVTADVSREADCQRLIGAAVEADGRLDVVVNCAGAIVRKTIDQLSAEEWDHVLGINLKGIFLCIKYALEPLKRSGGGRVINIASISGLVGMGHSAYCASKGGVIALSRELVSELAPHNITINCIAPGFVETPFTANLLAVPAVRRHMTNLVPLGRLSRPEDQAAAAVFLASDEAAYITGHTIVVDGGLTSTIYMGEVAAAYKAFEQQ